MDETSRGRAWRRKEVALSPKLAAKEKVTSDRVSEVRQEARFDRDATEIVMRGSMTLKTQCAGGLTNAEADERLSELRLPAARAPIRSVRSLARALDTTTYR